MTTATRMKVTKPDGLNEAERVRAAEQLALAHDQQVQLRAGAASILEALATGLSRYRDVMWEWDDRDMAHEDPTDWRRCAKIALLFAQLDALKHEFEWQAASRPLKPLWCVECSGPFPGEPYIKSCCLQHDATPASAANWAAFLFGAK